MKMQVKKHNKGFTLIELLVVVAIIGVLASVIVVSLNSARAKTRDARRLADFKQIQNALELYFNDNGRYPNTDPIASTGSWSKSPCGTGLYQNILWCELNEELSPYLSADIGDPKDNALNPSPYGYYYDSDPGDNFKSYGLFMFFESDSNQSKAQNDGGFDPERYEVGPQPQYCMEKYGTNWINTARGGTQSYVCDFSGN